MTKQINIIGKRNERYYYFEINNKIYLADYLNRYTAWIGTGIKWKIIEITGNRDSLKIKPLSLVQRKFKIIDLIFSFIVLIIGIFYRNDLEDISFQNNYLIKLICVLTFFVCLILYYFSRLKLDQTFDTIWNKKKDYLILESEASRKSRVFSLILFLILTIFLIIYGCSLNSFFLILIFAIFTPLLIIMSPYLMINRKFKGKNVTVTNDLTIINKYEFKKGSPTKKEKYLGFLSIFGIILVAVSFMYQQCIEFLMLSFLFEVIVFNTYLLEHFKNVVHNARVSYAVGVFSTIRNIGIGLLGLVIFGIILNLTIGVGR